MREMSDNELKLYQIIKRNPNLSNYELCREFYWEVYGVNLPKLDGKETIWTIERTIRTLKALYPNELTTKEERKIKAEMVDIYKEQALDRNKPIKPVSEAKNKPQEKFEQVGLGTMGRNKEWW